MYVSTYCVKTGSLCSTLILLSTDSTICLLTQTPRILLTRKLPIC
ncbi:hypothetical protein LINGRAHAP2_LOCUS14854 [Linum grandiflorum]